MALNVNKPLICVWNKVNQQNWIRVGSEKDLAISEHVSETTA